MCQQLWSIALVKVMRFHYPFWRTDRCTGHCLQELTSSKMHSKKWRTTM